MVFSGRTLTFQERLFYLPASNTFKKDKKRFLFHLKKSFRSHDIYTFVLSWVFDRIEKRLD